MSAYTYNCIHIHIHLQKFLQRSEIRTAASGPNLASEQGTAEKGFVGFGFWVLGLGFTGLGFMV